MNEWGFASEVSKWWEKAAAENPAWRFHGVRVEEAVPGSRQRSDLLVLGDQPALCGEIRLPDHQQSSPLDFDNLRDAVSKALTHGCRWAFTSDTKSIFLIDTHQGGSLITKIVHKEVLGEGVTRAGLDDPTTLAKVSKAWVSAFHDLAPIISGSVKPSGMAADQLFVEALRELMAAPVAAIRDAMNERRMSDPQFEADLVEWMVDDQGWTHDPGKWEAEVIRAAKLTAYVFVTRVLFYEALRRSMSELSPLSLPPSNSNNSRLAVQMLSFQFSEARRVTGDYETIFTWDRVSQYAIISDSVVPFWRRMVDHIEHFDLTTIDHDILGRLFERLIEPNERYEWGQHYTSSDVVDLMLSFAISDGTGAVLDPAIGGGTFLVRAYARKKALLPEQTHQQRLEQLFGVDVSRFPSTLATVNLAIRQLAFEDNYPRVATRSFFRLHPGDQLMTVPRSGSSDASDQVSVVLPYMKAVVGNPPYIRVHKLGKDRQAEATRVLGRGSRVRSPKNLSKAANYHTYFWFHGSQFLEPEGYLAFLTSGEWMDSDYGVALQSWLLDNFCIEAFIESGAEAWFSEARVGTVVTIARQNGSSVDRDANIVRFVTLRRPLRDLIGLHDSPIEHLQAVDALRDRILALSGSGEGSDMDWSAVSQAELRALGKS